MFSYVLHYLLCLYKNNYFCTKIKEVDLTYIWWNN